MDFITLEVVPFIKHHPMLSIGWVAVFVLIIYMTIKAKFSKVKIVNTTEAIELINRQDGVIVDLRTADNFRKGHITDAINVIPSEIKNGNVGTLAKYKNSPIILVDDNGISVSASGELLVKQGFERVFTLKDGMASWFGEKLPLVKK